MDVGSTRKDLTENMNAMLLINMNVIAGTANVSILFCAFHYLR